MIQDDAAATQPHVGYGQPGCPNRRIQGVVEGTLPLVVACLEQSSTAGPTNVVDQYVDSAKRLDGSSHDRLDNRRLGEIATHGEHSARAVPRDRFGSELVGCGLEAGFVTAGDTHTATLVKQSPSAGQPKPSAGTGHDRNLVGEA